MSKKVLKRVASKTRRPVSTQVVSKTLFLFALVVELAVATTSCWCATGCNALSLVFDDPTLVNHELCPQEFKNS